MLYCKIFNTKCYILFKMSAVCLLLKLWLTLNVPFPRLLKFKDVISRVNRSGILKKSFVSNHNFRFGHSDIKRSYPNEKIRYPEVILYYRQKQEIYLQALRTYALKANVKGTTLFSCGNNVSDDLIYRKYLFSIIYLEMILGG